MSKTELHLYFIIACLSMFQTLPIKAQQVLVDENNMKVSYFTEPDYLKFIIETTGYPRIDADVNQNRRIDSMVDRSYGVFLRNDSTFLCAQFLIWENASTECGRPTGALFEKADNKFIFSIPYNELSKQNNGLYFVSFKMWNRSNWFFYPSEEMGRPYVIDKNRK